MKQDKGTKINNNTRLKMLDRAIKSYKAQRLRIQADEIMRKNIQSTAIKRQEEYDYEEPRFNMFAKYTWEDVCDAIETMNEKELDELMDICDVDNIDDLYEYVATCFLLDEA